MSVAVRKKGGKAEGVTSREIKARAERMLAALDLQGAELSILLTDDRTIWRLNREFRGKDRPTDVLAFALLEGEQLAAEGDAQMLGDVVISLDTAARQADERGWAPLDEATHLLAHGLLHLVGYDHETDREEREMNAATKVLVRSATGSPQISAAKKTGARGNPRH